MEWIYLIIAGIFEVVWAVALKYAQGFTKLIPSVATVVGMGISFTFLSMSLKSLPIGTAYAIWTGIGAVGTVILGMVFFGEPKTLIRVVFILLILVGIIGLKITADA